MPASLASAGLPMWVKLEIHPDPTYLLPDPIETLKAAEILVKEGFVVLPYINADPVLAKRLQDVGTATVMPLGSPIGSNQGIESRRQIEIIIAQATVPVVVDAGIGRPSHAAEALEMGADAVLVNTAIAIAGNPPAVASAFRMAVEAGRIAFESGGSPKYRLLHQRAAPSPDFSFPEEKADSLFSMKQQNHPDAASVDIILPLDLSEDETARKKAVGRKLKIHPARIQELRLKKHSIDARKKDIKVQLRFEVGIDGPLPSGRADPSRSTGSGLRKRRSSSSGAVLRDFLPHSLQLGKDGVRLSWERGEARLGTPLRSSPSLATWYGCGGFELLFWRGLCRYLFGREALHPCDQARSREQSLRDPRRARRSRADPR